MNALLSQVNPLDFGRNFRAAEDNGLHWWNVALAVAILAAIVILVVLLARYAGEREGRNYRSTSRLFHDLCRAHALDRDARKLLQRLAQQQGLSQPALLFVDPECFDPEHLGPIWAAEKERLIALRETIFGD